MFITINFRFIRQLLRFFLSLSTFHVFDNRIFRMEKSYLLSIRLSYIFFAHLYFFPYMYVSWNSKFWNTLKMLITFDRGLLLDNYFKGHFQSLIIFHVSVTIIVFFWLENLLTFSMTELSFLQINIFPFSIWVRVLKFWILKQTKNAYIFW